MNNEKVVNKYEYKIPSWAMSQLINGDCSGLDDKELKAIRDFELVVLAKHGSGHWSIESEEKYFSWHNDVTDLGNDVYDCVYVVIEDASEEEKLVTGTWLPVFPGFYETYFNGDCLYDSEIEYIRETVKPEELADVLVDKFYETKAFDKLYKEYQESIAKQCVSVIWNELRNLHYVEDMQFEEICSPKYYNFVNDSINVKVTFSDENIRNIKTMIQEHEDEWNEYLKQTYTSRDGFISHHSNNPDAEEWDIEAALSDRHNAGAILEFICRENNITDETLYYGCVDNVQMDIELHKKECIERGWYVPKNICLDWFKSLKPRFCNNYKFERRVTFGFSTQYIFDTPKQRYIFSVTKQEPKSDGFIVKRIFKIFLFAKLKEEKRHEDNN